MTNRISQLRPASTLVDIPFLSLLFDWHNIRDWLAARTQGDAQSIEVFGWEDDDPLDHFVIWRVIGGCAYPHCLTPDREQLYVWQEGIERDHQGDALALFAFTNPETAMLFKLTFGGAR